jgi:hypothetical protein
MNRFLCWTDSNGKRGYILATTPHTFKQVGVDLYLVADTVLVKLTTADDIFLVTRNEQAFAWVKTGDDSAKLAESVTEKGIV